MDLNVVILSGRLGKDPELKTGSSGAEYANFSLAVNRLKEKGKEGKTDWVRCTAFGKNAVFLTTYFKKGDGIILTGRLENDPYEDKDGNKHDGSKIMIDRLFFSPGKNAREDNKPAANQAFEGFSQVSGDEIPF